MARANEKLHLKCFLVNLNLNSYIWLVATILYIAPEIENSVKK